MVAPIKAKKLSEKIFKEKLPPLYSEYYLSHSKFVIIAAKDLSKEKNLNISPEIFEIAGYLHDLGYSVDDKNHAEESVKIAKNNFPGINAVIIDCIQNHGSDKKPLTKEGKIFQLADKLAAFYPKCISEVIKLEQKEGKLTYEEIIEKLNTKLQKYLDAFEDEGFKRLSNKYYKDFMKKYHDKNLLKKNSIPEIKNKFLYEPSHCKSW